MKPWQQLDKESAKAYSAAKIYFELGPERSHEAVSQELGKSKALIQRWSTRYGWIKRAREYDKEFSTALPPASFSANNDATNYNERIAKLRLRKVEIQEKVFDRIEKMLSYPLTRTESGDGTVTINPTNWTLKDVIPLVEVCSKLERLEIGGSA